jgi:hypothetical protein
LQCSRRKTAALTAHTAVAAIAPKESAVAAVTTITAVDALGGPCDEAARRTGATVSTVAVAARVTAVTAVATRAHTVAAAELHPVPAVPGSSSEQPCVATVTAVEPVATPAEEQAGITAVTALHGAATCGVVGEAVPTEQPCIGRFRGSIAEENVQARAGLGSDPFDRLRDSEVLGAARLGHKAPEVPRHRHGLGDAR